MKRTLINRVDVTFDAKSENESLSRVLVAAFVLHEDVTAEQLADMKTAVSEAVTNAIVHAYRDEKEGKVRLTLSRYDDGLVRIVVADRGCGIADVERAREPFFTTDREHERSGMGFSIMETFMQNLRVTSRVGSGTRVVLEKTIARAS